ncbi:hypothetical protein [Bradyrhizobium sp. U531]|uniref:hypothetical protein n=1 Tax=Bradyrhizobium sp. U531 TaxID=3053458 RepID=UPI003F68766E
MIERPHSQVYDKYKKFVDREAFDLPQKAHRRAVLGYLGTVSAKFALGQEGGGTDLDFGRGTVFS